MNDRIFKRVLVGLFLVALLVGPSARRAARACGPGFTLPVFVATAHPDPDWDRFVAGSLGLIQPTWARSQLFVAYRYLSGRPLSATEQAGVARRWTGPVERAPSPDIFRDLWQRARDQVPQAARVAPPQLYTYDEKTHSYYLNCPADAFGTASGTLHARIEQFGAASAAVREWLAGQDAVFANCAKPSGVPGPVAADQPDVIRADRDYQVASALFYAGDFQGARQKFVQIAADSKSPWSSVSRYLVARTFIRQGTVAGDRSSLERAEQELKRLRSDAALAAFHPSVDGLLAFVSLRLEPAAALQSLASALARGVDDERAEQQLDEYTILLDRFADGVTPRLSPAGQLPRADGLNEIRAANEMTDWILTIQAPESSGAGSHALDRWRQTSSSAWLVAALSKAGPGDEAAATLIDGANRVPQDSPAFPSATYHAIRLLMAKGERDSARIRLDAILPRARKGWPRSALNAVLAQRASLVTNIADFISVGLRRPAFFATTMEDTTTEPETRRGTGPTSRHRASGIVPPN